MNILIKIIRFFPKLRFKLLNLATVKDIPTDRFNQLIKELISDGWKKTYEYSGFDAWIDYGNVKLKKGNMKLTCEWDNWTEGSIEGPHSFIEEFAKKKKLLIINEWRWSEYDNN